MSLSDLNWILKHSLSFYNSIKFMPKFQRLTKVKLIRNTLGTIVNCEQRRATRTLDQARKPLAHGNMRCHKIEKWEVFWRNEGGF